MATYQRNAVKGRQVQAFCMGRDNHPQWFTDAVPEHIYWDGSPFGNWYIKETEESYGRGRIENRDYVVYRGPHKFFSVPADVFEELYTLIEDGISK
jgi:hypothetical protein